MTHPKIKAPWGAIPTIQLTATGDQTISVENDETVIDGVIVQATGNRTLNITAEGINLGAKLYIKSKTVGTQTTIFGTGITGTTITGVAGKTITRLAIYDGTGFIIIGEQID
jgi:hypothetical protein